MLKAGEKMFVENLRNVAKSKQMTQADVVKASGLSKSSVSDYFAGKSMPKNDALKKLAAALGVSVEELTESKTKKITVMQAAKLMGCDSQFVRVGLQQGVLPFGWAVKVGQQQYSYYISPKLFNEYTGIKV